MSTYLYKLNGKTFSAVDSVTNEKVVIAIAPFFTKPNSKTYQWLSNIGTFSDKSLKNRIWVTSSELKKERESELRCVDIRPPKKEHNYNYNYEYFDYKEQSRSYWKLKRIIEKEFEKNNINLVCFIDDVKDIGRMYDGRPIESVSVYKINGFLWGDEPKYNTPQKGVVDLINGQIIYKPNVLSDIIS